MKTGKNKVVAISYELEVEGQLADRADENNPLVYTHGTGMLLPRFEQELEGKEAGEEFAFTLSPAEGYGEYRQDHRIDIPKTAFMIDGVLQEELIKVGNVIPMVNSAGQPLQGTVAAVGEEKVTMDFNHPMAGKTLNFKGKVLSVREAEPEELSGSHCKGKKGCCHEGSGEKCHDDGEGCCHGEGEGCCRR